MQTRSRELRSGRQTCICLSIILALSPLLPRGANAQTNRVTFQRISIEEGLSQSIVQGMIQDKRGFMWFGTEDGLNRYDGYGFVVIRNDPSSSASLSHNDVTTLLEDRSGIIWLGTNNGGLNRYDPANASFIRYRLDRENSRSISSDFITTLYEDSEGTLWIGTTGGLNCLTVSNRSASDSAVFGRFLGDPNDRNSLSNNTIRAICEEKDGTLWVGTERGLNEVVRTKGNGASAGTIRFVPSYSRPGNTTTLTDDRIRTIYQDKSGTLWIGTENGLNAMVRRSRVGVQTGSPKFVQYRHTPSNPSSLNHNSVYALFEDKNGTFWVGTNGGGVDEFDRAHGRFVHHTNDPRDQTSLSYNEIRCIYEDHSGNLWIGTYGGGISKVDRGRKPFHHYTRDPESGNTLSEPIVWCVHEDDEGMLWIGTHGGGLNKLDRLSGRYTQYRFDARNRHGLPSDFIRCIEEDRQGYLWLGTGASGIARFDRRSGACVSYQNVPADPTSLSNNTIRAMHFDREGTLWIGTLGGGLNKMIPSRTKQGAYEFVRYLNDPSDSTSISNNALRSIHEDSRGILWIGTYGSGFDMFDPSTGTFRHFQADASNPNALSNNYVFTITEDRAGNLWVGTWGGGLNKFDRKTGLFRSYRHTEGLPSDAVYGILEDNAGCLWISSNKGLSRFDPQTHTFRNFDVSDGLQSDEFNGGSYFKNRTGEMFFGGINGFNAFMPSEILDNPYVPPVVLTSFRKLNEEVRFDRNIADVRDIVLSYQDYVFTFEFAALDYTNPAKNRYAYKMAGLDRDWVVTDARKRFAHYTTLPPGEYDFRVKGSNNDGVWNDEGLSVHLVITPPFWRTVWFGGLVVLFVTTTGVVLYSRRMKNVRAKAELQTAHDAQMSIMPQEDPRIPGVEISGICVPANEVGGDFFDYLWWREGGSRIGIVVGDVSGKAMKAAMTAVMTSGMIRSEATEQHAVGDVLSRVNKPLFEKTHKEMFVVACLATLDLRSKSLVFSNAGLTKPILKSKGTITNLEAKGATHPLGLFEACAYRETRVKLKSGDVVVFCTDGVQEAQNRTKEFYGDERLHQLLQRTDTAVYSAGAIKDIIIQDVRMFTGSAPQHDDMTVVVVRIL